jgi:hypothetical protein
MPRYRVEISQRMWNTLAVEAEDENEARMKVYDLWDKFIMGDATHERVFTEGECEDFQVEGADELPEQCYIAANPEPPFDPDCPICQMIRAEQEQASKT